MYFRLFLHIVAPLLNAGITAALSHIGGGGERRFGDTFQGRISGSPEHVLGLALARQLQLYPWEQVIGGWHQIRHIGGGGQGPERLERRCSCTDSRRF